MDLLRDVIMGILTIPALFYTARSGAELVYNYGIGLDMRIKGSRKQKKRME